MKEMKKGKESRGERAGEGERKRIRKKREKE